MFTVFFDVAQDVDVALLESTVCVLYISLQSKDIDLQSVCAGFFYLFGKFNPISILIAVDTGNDRNVTNFLALFD